MASLAMGSVLVVGYVRGALAGLRPGMLLLVALVLRLAVLPLPPTLSDDAYRYVWDGRLTAAGIDAYLYTPEELPAAARAIADPSGELFAQLNSSSYYSVYPAPSQLLFAAASRLAHNVYATFVWIKAIMVALELGALFLLARCVAPGLVALYAWHPLAVLEIAGQGHTEGLMVAGFLAGVAALRLGAERWAVAAATAGAWVKLAPLLAVPFLLRRVGWRRLGVSAGVTALLWAAFASAELVPNVLESLRLYVQLFEFNAGPYLAVKHVLLAATGVDYSKTLGPTLSLLFLVAVAILYVVDRDQRLSFSGAALLVLGGFLLCTTTVHPWYVLMPLCVLPAVWSGSGRGLRTWAWGWWWLGLCVPGTYAFYAGSTNLAIVAGVLGWAGVAVATGLALARSAFFAAGLSRLMQRRGAAKWAWVAPYVGAPNERLGPYRLLDLGAGEGWVGAAAASNTEARVDLADVLDLNQTDLPHTLIDGDTLPFAADTFDAVLLVFVLHHAAHPERVLRETRRVLRGGGRVVVVESVYSNAVNRRLLRLLDRLANRLRSGGAMTGQEEHLAFDTAEGWRARFEALGFEVLAENRRGRYVHQQHLFVLAKSQAAL